MQIAHESEERGGEEEMSLDDLRSKIKEEYETIQGFSRKTAVHTYHLGHYLSLAKTRVENRTWGEFLKKVGVSVATDNRARKVFAFFHSEKELEGLTITKAYEMAGISLGKEEAEQQVDEPAAAEVNNDGDAAESEADESNEDELDTDEDELEDEESVESDADEDELPPSIPMPKQKTVGPQTPPTKEDGEGFEFRLAQWVDRAARLAEQVATITPTKAETEHWLALLSEARGHVETIEEALSHV